MNSAVLLPVLAVLAISAGIAHAEALSPYQQLKEGVPADQIACADGKNLMASPSGSPACVFATSVEVLIDRGFEKIEPVANPASGPGATTEEPRSIPSEIVSANNAFAFDFYRQVSHTGNNVFFSPISMHMAFSAVYEGAGGNTALQIRDVFGLEDDGGVRHGAVSDAMSSLNRDDPHATLEMANSLWIAEWFAPLDSYVDTARVVYLADVESVDFLDDGEDGAVSLINEWANEKTHGKISQVIKPAEVSDLTIMTLLNAIYFKGTWATEFPESDTYEADFWTGSETVQADFMSVLAEFNYADEDGVQVIEMPYVGDRLSMLVFLPREVDGIQSLEKSITPEMVEKWREFMYRTEVEVSMPKFEIKTHYNLIEPLNNLGVLDAFSLELASFPNIGSGGSQGGLYISKATQDAYVKVNEQGTEAAAVTILGGHMASNDVMLMDHPFIFAIQDDESGTILFIGKIVDPTA